MRYTEDHLWLEEEDGEIVIGVTEYGIERMGKLIFIDAPEVGTVLTGDEEMFVVEGEEATIEFLSPIDGTVSDVNPAVKGDLEAIEDDPTDHGWILRIEGDGVDLEDFLTETAYNKLTA